MAIAARQRGMQLEIQHAQHDHLQMIRLAEGIAARPQPPDHTVVANDKLTGPAMLDALARSTTRVVVIHSDITADQRRNIGNERERFVNWIGSAVPDARAGCSASRRRSIARSAIRRSGHSASPARALHAGLERAGAGPFGYIAGVLGARLEQLVYGDWTGPDAQRKASILLARYPQAKLVWAANDEMALGALRAATERDLRPRSGGMGGWSEAPRRIADGRMTATLVGRHLIGLRAGAALRRYATPASASPRTRSAGSSVPSNSSATPATAAAAPASAWRRAASCCTAREARSRSATSRATAANSASSCACRPRTPPCPPRRRGRRSPARSSRGG